MEYIVLPTFAYEHKIFVGPFSRKFPRAQVWVAPRQWSWPLNLPLEFFGIFRAKTLKDKDLSTPWADEIEQKVLSSPEVGNIITEYSHSHASSSWCNQREKCHLLVNFLRNRTVCGGGFLS